MNDLLGIVALFFLVLMNGFFVAAEFALVSVRRTRIDQLAEEGNATARARSAPFARMPSKIEIGRAHV